MEIHAIFLLVDELLDVRNSCLQIVQEVWQYSRGWIRLAEPLERRLVAYDGFELLLHLIVHDCLAVEAPNQESHLHLKLIDKRVVFLYFLVHHVRDAILKSLLELLIEKLLADEIW